MRFNDSLTRALLALAATAALFAAPASAPRAHAQEADKQGPPASKGEAELGEKINKAPDAAAKLALAEEFVKKYPKSAYRQRLADYVAGEIDTVADPAQKITLTEKYLAVFNAPAEAVLVTPGLVNLYVNANRLDDAFRVGGSWLATNPEEVQTRAQLAIVGINEAQRQNAKYAPQSIDFARQAVALLEGTKPASVDDARWGQLKTRWLPSLYQALGIVAYSQKNVAEARSHLDKAIALSTTDPMTYFILADMTDAEYADLAAKYKAMSPGAEQDAQLKLAMDKLDQAIDFYARAVALTEGRAEYAALRTHIMEPLTAYYKYRHNGSTDGLQQLIDKYKTAAKP